MLRWASPGDTPELAQVFFAAVREGASPYSDAQRKAWLPASPGGRAWAERLEAKHVAVAERDGVIAGFISVEAGGYIDLAFIRPEHQGTGLFGQIFQKIESWARNHSEPRLWTHASLMAQPAFRAKGFLVIHHETVERDGQKLTRAKMEKILT
ncbi:GNAT family N-acetyltransferase [Roseobacter sp. YSTF-M11]|uniref:GNAT family N-acetyltransferase n=1 Tax=Roseobacter insulae TaxID=2859783 RepID=A0A9X1JZJ4_9RHOB|nr:GNAT family N-acetyltransferase [Roseobacter insulae]MBW4709441.1 GNAT family N-acetyltransferase [Roseobacter insulae]